MADLRFLPVINAEDKEVPQSDGQLIVQIQADKRGLYIDYNGVRYLITGGGTSVEVDGNPVATLAFKSDPQGQIDGKSSITIGGQFAENVAFSEAPQAQIDQRAIIKVASQIVADLAFTSDPQTQLDDLARQIAAKPDLLDIFPVGSIIYSSVESFNPASAFGGSWTKIAEGRVILGASRQYPLNSTGGAATVTLTVAEMPAHTHNVAGSVSQGTGDTCLLGQERSGTAIEAAESVGGGQAHNNMMPYVAKYIWQRDA